MASSMKYYELLMRSVDMPTRKKIFKLLIFLLFIILGQKIIVYFFPFGEFIGLKKYEWLTWFFDWQLFLINLAFGMIAIITTFFMVWKLSWLLNILVGAIIGVYFSLLFFPYNYKHVIENRLLSENPSIWSVGLLYFVIIFMLPTLLVFLAKEFDKIVSKGSGLHS
jgi:hypothetical protein